MSMHGEQALALAVPVFEFPWWRLQLLLWGQFTPSHHIAAEPGEELQDLSIMFFADQVVHEVVEGTWL